MGRVTINRQYINELLPYFVGRQDQQVLEGPILPAAAHTGYIGTAARPWKEINADYIKAHVELNASVFAYDVISAINGHVIITNATTLAVALDGYQNGAYAGEQTTIKATEAAFTYDSATGKGSLIKIRDFVDTSDGQGIAIHQEFILVQSSATGPDANGFYTYTVIRGYNGENPSAWPIKTALTEYGRINRWGGTSYASAYWDGGWVALRGGSTIGAPHLAVYERTGTGVNDYVARVVIGVLGTVTDRHWGSLSSGR